MKHDIISAVAKLLWVNKPGLFVGVAVIIAGLLVPSKKEEINGDERVGYLFGYLILFVVLAVHTYFGVKMYINNFM